MIKSALLLCALLLYGSSTSAQDTLYDYIRPGNFQVGYLDTLLFGTSYHYEAYNYAGEKPLFIHIWHPLVEHYTNPTYLTFNDFFDWETDSGLSVIHQELKKHYQEAVIRDCVEENLLTGKANDFGAYTYTDMLTLLGKRKTKSILHRNITHSNYPVILYHHGSQSYPFENFAMAEYFASRGYIFVSANFHLPYENTSFGLKPYAKIIHDEDEESLKRIRSFAQSLTNSNSVFFIGHSWGAQMGLRTFDGDSTLTGMISLETTIEFKTDHAIIKDMWPEVYQKIIVDNVAYPFPILFCAATGQEKPFDFFTTINAPQITFAPTKEAFEHNAYTSAFYLRYFLPDTIRQTDTELLLDRLKLYVKHVELRQECIEGVGKNKDIGSTAVRFVR